MTCLPKDGSAAASRRTSKSPASSTSSARENALDGLVTHTFPLTRVNEALEQIVKGTADLAPATGTVEHVN